MENSSFKKQAKSDIFKELYPVINLYIRKGAKPNALKKYYKNNKRFNDLLDDIKNKGVNLIKDEQEYKKLVREILNDMLDDFIAKCKDEDYKKNKESKMKHIKEFYSFEMNMNFFKKEGDDYANKLLKIIENENVEIKLEDVRSTRGAWQGKQEIVQTIYKVKIDNNSYTFSHSGKDSALRIFEGNGERLIKKMIISYSIIKKIEKLYEEQILPKLDDLSRTAKKYNL